MSNEHEVRPQVRDLLDRLHALGPTAAEKKAIGDELEIAGVYGRPGGLKLKRQKGPAYYKRIGKLGGRPKKKRRKDAKGKSKS